MKKEEEEEEGCCAPEVSPPPVPRTIRLWQVPQGQTVNFNKLWVTVSDKSPSDSLPELGGFFHCVSTHAGPYHDTRAGGIGGGDKCPFMPH